MKNWQPIVLGSELAMAISVNAFDVGQEAGRV